MLQLHAKIDHLTRLVEQLLPKPTPTKLDELDELNEETLTIGDVLWGVLMYDGESVI